MRRLFVAALLLCTTMAVARADQELTVYFFWTRDCPYCDQAQTFLNSTRAEDPTIKLRDFEVENSLANAIILNRVYKRIGLADLRAVPLILVGTRVFIGFDNNTSKDVLEGINECRKNTCRDIVHDLIQLPTEWDQASAFFIPPPLCQSKVGTTIVSK